MKRAQGENKIVTLEQFASRRLSMRAAGERLVFTNGCFDILHPGHVHYLRRARSLGDRLLVAVNADETVKSLKGSSRPVVPLGERMELLAALEFIDFVASFSEPTPLQIITAVMPDVLVKGGDWTPDNIVGRDVVVENGGTVLSLPFTEGYSTSDIIQRIVERLGDAHSETPE